MTQPPAPGPWPRVENNIDGTVTGQAVQAGAIYGGVHYHVNTPAPAPQPTLLPMHVPPRQRSQVWSHLGRWFVALLPLVLATAAVGGVADAIAAGAPFWLRLLVALMILTLGVLVIVVWSAASGREFVELLNVVLDKATPRLLETLQTRTLGLVAGCSCAVWLFGVTREMLEISRDPRSVGANGALLFFAFVAVLTGRLVVRRHR